MQNLLLAVVAAVGIGLIALGSHQTPASPPPELGAELLKVASSNGGSRESLLHVRDVFGSIASGLRFDAGSTKPRISTSGAVEDLRLVTIALTPSWGLSGSFAAEFGAVVGPHLDLLGTSGGDALTADDKKRWAEHYDAVGKALEWAAGQVGK